MSEKNQKLLSRWLKSFNSACTVKNYQVDIQQFSAWLSDKDILKVVEKDVRNFILDLEEKGLTKRTRNRRLAAIKSFYKWLWENREINENPTVRIRLERLSENEKRVEPLDERVAINLLSIVKTNTMTGIRTYAILDLLLGTGIRREELTGLDTGDAHISQTRPSTIMVRKGKGDKPRIIPLAKPQKESLIKWLEVRQQYAQEIKSEAVFVTRLGTRPSGESIRKIIKTKLKQLGIEEKGIAVHALRHLFVSDYNEVTQNDLVGLRGITGHTSLDNLQICTHQTFKRILENMEKMKLNRNR
jgi:site-specific recombinase XerD